MIGGTSPAMSTFLQPPSDAANRKLRPRENPSQYSRFFMLKAASFLVQAVSLAWILHALCSAADPADRTPIQAELVKSIEAGHVQVGEPVYAKVDLAWNSSAC